ncbi:MAG: hypothetical protein QF898_10370 [SAR202 cluster bacterium]|nr:hypothetical protein [SAR202 cluster bacterium]
MLIIIVLALTLIPTLAILWPFVVGVRRDEFAEDESAPVADLMRRWDAAVDGLKSSELDHAIGNLTDEDYRVIRHQMMTEAAVILKTMELEEAEEEQMLSAVTAEMQAVRARVVGDSDSES